MIKKIREAIIMRKMKRKTKRFIKKYAKEHEEELTRNLFGAMSKFARDFAEAMEIMEAMENESSSN